MKKKEKEAIRTRATVICWKKTKSVRYMVDVDDDDDDNLTTKTKNDVDDDDYEKNVFK